MISDVECTADCQVGASVADVLLLEPKENVGGPACNSYSPTCKRLKTGDFDLPEEEAVIIKHLLTNISNAVCHRLSNIDEQLESVCASTQFVEDNLDRFFSCLKTPQQSPQRITEKHHLSSKNGSDLRLQEQTDQGCPIDCDITPPQVQELPLSTEDKFPNGTWLGFENDPLRRVRVGISASNLLDINAACRTPVKMALTLLDYLFDRDTQACSNLSGAGKHGKYQLDPVLIYGIRCHLERVFQITEDDWQQIRHNIDSKCRSAFRRKNRGLPLTVKAFRFRDVELPLFQLDPRASGAETCSDNLHQQNELSSSQEDLSGQLTISPVDVVSSEEGSAPVQVVCVTADQLAELRKEHTIVHLIGQTDEQRCSQPSTE